MMRKTARTKFGTATPLANFKGKAILLVNVASRCGYTPQYEGLQALYRKYGKDGLVIVGVPANNFGKQEPGSNEEIAQKLKLPVRTIEAVDRSGRDPDGKPIEGLPAGVDLGTSAFATDVGVENDAVQLPGGAYLWYDVVAVKASRELKLDEVKDKVEARFHEDEITKRLDAKTADLVGKLKAGAALADVAAAEGLKVETKWGLKRQGTAMPPRVMTEAFRLAKDQAGSAEGQNPAERVIFRVTDIKVPPFEADSLTTAKTIDQLKEAHPHVRVLSFDELLSLGEENPVEPVAPTKDDLCCIMYTSGSTGTPKGVPLKHKNVIAAGKSISLGVLLP